MRTISYDTKMNELFVVKRKHGIKVGNMGMQKKKKKDKKTLSGKREEELASSKICL